MSSSTIIKVLALLVGLVLFTASCSYLYWGFSALFIFNRPPEPTLSVHSLDPNVIIERLDGGYNITISWYNAYYKDYVEIALDFYSTGSRQLQVNIYRITGLGSGGRVFLIAKSYCYVHVVGYFNSIDSCGSLEYTLMNVREPTTSTFTINYKPAGYLRLVVRINNWGAGSGVVGVSVVF